MRTRHGPSNNAVLNNIALAIIFHSGFPGVEAAVQHFAMDRDKAIRAITQPGCSDLPCPATTTSTPTQPVRRRRRIRAHRGGSTADRTRLALFRRGATVRTGFVGRSGKTCLPILETPKVQKQVAA